MALMATFSGSAEGYTCIALAFALVFVFAFVLALVGDDDNDICCRLGLA
jgi:hypothetical protein